MFVVVVCWFGWCAITGAALAPGAPWFAGFVTGTALVTLFRYRSGRSGGSGADGD